MKIRMKSAIGFAPTAEAGPANTRATGPADPAGSPVEVTAARGPSSDDFPPNSRLLAAATAHANGAPTGPSPEPPAPNHDNKPPLTPDTAPEAAADNTGTDTAAAPRTRGDAAANAGPPAAAPGTAERPAARGPEISTDPTSTAADSARPAAPSETTGTDNDPRSPAPRRAAAAPGSPLTPPPDPTPDSTPAEDRAEP